MHPASSPPQDDAPLLRRSHATLLICRHGASFSSALELRHQRTPDTVFAAPTPPGGAAPPAVFEMIETLLPDARPAATAGGTPRLLELAWGLPPHAQRVARPGWATLVQRGALADRQ